MKASGKRNNNTTVNNRELSSLGRSHALPGDKEIEHRVFLNVTHGFLVGYHSEIVTVAL